MSPITTHVLDTSCGRPAAGLPIRIEIKEGESWTELASKVTNEDGRVTDLLPEGSLKAATYRITFDTGSYFDKTGTKAFYPYVEVAFSIDNTDQHYHVPLLLNPFGYSTYRGS